MVELARELDRLPRRRDYTLNDHVPRASELAGSNVEVIADQKRAKLDPAVLMRLHRKIRAWGADIVHGFLYDADIYVRIAAIGTGAVVLNSERSDNYEISRVQMLAHRLTRELVDGVVANSRSGAQFARLLRLPAAPMRGLERHARGKCERRGVSGATTGASSSARATTVPPA